MVKFDGGGEIYLECDGQRLPEFKVDSDDGAPISSLPDSEKTKATHAKVAYVPAQRGKSFCIVGSGFRLPFQAAEKASTQPMSSGKTLRAVCHVWSQGLDYGGRTYSDPDSFKKDGYINEGMKYTFQFTEQTTGQLPHTEGKDGKFDTKSLAFRPAEFLVTVAAWEFDPSEPIVRSDHVVTGQLQTTPKGSKAHSLGVGASGKAEGSAAESTKARGRRRPDLPVYRIKFLLSSARLLILQGIMPDEDFPSPQPVAPQSNQGTPTSSPSRQAIMRRQANIRRSTRSRVTRSLTRSRNPIKVEDDVEGHVDDEDDDDDDGTEVIYTSTRSPHKRPRRSDIVDLTID